MKLLVLSLWALANSCAVGDDGSFDAAVRGVRVRLLSPAPGAHWPEAPPHTDDPATAGALGDPKLSSSAWVMVSVDAEVTDGPAADAVRGSPFAHALCYAPADATAPYGRRHDDGDGGGGGDDDKVPVATCRPVLCPQGGCGELAALASLGALGGQEALGLAAVDAWIQSTHNAPPSVAHAVGRPARAYLWRDPAVAVGALRTLLASPLLDLDLTIEHALDEDDDDGDEDDEDDEDGDDEAQRRASLLLPLSSSAALAYPRGLLRARRALLELHLGLALAQEAAAWLRKAGDHRDEASGEPRERAREGAPVVDGLSHGGARNGGDSDDGGGGGDAVAGLSFAAADARAVLAGSLGAVRRVAITGYEDSDKVPGDAKDGDKGSAVGGAMGGAMDCGAAAEEPAAGAVVVAPPAGVAAWAPRAVHLPPAGRDSQFLDDRVALVTLSNAGYVPYTLNALASLRVKVRSCCRSCCRGGCWRALGAVCEYLPSTCAGPRMSVLFPPE